MAYPGTTPEIRELLEHVTAAGYTVQLAPGSNHWRITAADGTFRCTLPLTPSTRRAGAYARAACAAPASRSRRENTADPRPSAPSPPTPPP